MKKTGFEPGLGFMYYWSGNSSKYDTNIWRAWILFLFGSCSTLEDVRLLASARGWVNLAWEVLWSYWYPSWWSGFQHFFDRVIPLIVPVVKNNVWSKASVVSKVWMSGEWQCLRSLILVSSASVSYQEILTDPSYSGQFVLMTQPHIGNTGINLGTNFEAFLMNVVFVLNFCALYWCGVSLSQLL